MDEPTGLRTGAEREQGGDTRDSGGKGSVVVHQVSKWEVLSKGQRTSQRPRAAAGSVNNLVLQVYECSVCFFICCWTVGKRLKRSIKHISPPDCFINNPFPCCLSKC